WTSRKSAIRPLGSVPESPPPGFWTKTSLIVPDGSSGTVMDSVFASTSVTLKAGTPPTVTVAPSSKASPLIVAGPVTTPGPDAADREIRKRGENSDVFPASSVAVAVMGEPFGTAMGRTALKVASPDPLVVTGTEPRYVLPSGRSCGRGAQRELA